MKTYSTLQADAERLQAKLLSNPFFSFVREGEFSREFVKQIAVKQLRYNIEFVQALTRMRDTFASDRSFVVEFLDPHIATEFGGDLEVVKLEQRGTTHISMIYDFMDSADMSFSPWPTEPCVARFLQTAIAALIGGENKAKALGALYADEVFANTWFQPIYQGLLTYCDRTGTKLDLEFFRSHANDIEPAHQDHAFLIFGYHDRLNLDATDFNRGVAEFTDEIDRMFQSLFDKYAGDSLG